jgi:uncharacterized membrane protein
MDLFPCGKYLPFLTHVALLKWGLLQTILVGMVTCTLLRVFHVLRAVQ